MEVVGKLEISIQNLLAQNEFLKNEKIRLENKISVLTTEKNILEKENKNLHESLVQQEILRIDALRRIDGLLRKIQDYDKVD